MSIFSDMVGVYGQAGQDADHQKAQKNAEKALDGVDSSIKYPDTDTDWKNASTEQVRGLQTELVGMYGNEILPDHGVDGIWGPETEAAYNKLVEYQKLQAEGTDGSSESVNDLLNKNQTGVTESDDGYLTPVYGSPMWGFKKRWG